MSRANRRQTLFVLVFLIVVLGFVTTFRMGVVRGDSMYPTYLNGQVVLVRRRNWLSGPLHHNDVVLVRKDRDVLIKRVWRLPGEEVDDPGVRRPTFLNNLQDYYEQERVQTPDGTEETRLFVPQGFLVILGDNRRVSEDSRIFGPVPERDVLGVVVASPPPPFPTEPMPARPNASDRRGNVTASLPRRPVFSLLASASLLL
jgi:signal peptidase I